MSFQFIKQMPTPEKVKTDYPISPELAKIKESRDAEIKKVRTLSSKEWFKFVQQDIRKH